MSQDESSQGASQPAPPPSIRVIAESKDTSLWQLILIAVITAALTAALTTLVDRSRISGEHERWKKEQLILYHQSRLHDQTQLIREMVVSIVHLGRARNEFNYGFVYLIGERILVEGGHKDIDPSKTEAQINQVYSRYLKHWADVNGEFRQARLLFGENVRSKIETFYAYLTSEQYLYNDTHEATVRKSVQEALSQSSHPSFDLSRISQERSKPQGYQELMQHSKTLLQAMEAELEETRNALMQNVLGTDAL